MNAYTRKPHRLIRDENNNRLLEKILKKLCSAEDYRPTRRLQILINTYRLRWQFNGVVTFTRYIRHDGLYLYTYNCRVFCLQTRRYNTQRGNIWLLHIHLSFSTFIFNIIHCQRNSPSEFFIHSPFIRLGFFFFFLSSPNTLDTRVT